MATGEQGFGDSLFKLGTQRQAALSAEQTRIRNQDIIRRNDMDALSGFQASAIEGDQQRAMFEEAVAETQSYISGTGKYEDADYDAVNFKKQVKKIQSLYNGFKAHNLGDVQFAREQQERDAYTEGGTIQEGSGSLGTKNMSNNTPSSYNDAVVRHNNYFESAKTANGETRYDENGHPMGYPVINGEVDYSAAPISIFKMDAYANPGNFKGNTVEVAMATTTDLVQESKNSNSLNLRIQGLTGDDNYYINPETGAREGQRDARGLHDRGVQKFFNDKWDRPGQDNFRETLLVDLKAEGTDVLTPEQEQEFISGDFSNIDEEEINALRKDAEAIYSDRSWQNAAPEAGETDSPYANAADRGVVGPENPSGSGQYQISILKEAIDLKGIVNPGTGEAMVSEGEEASLIGVGVNSDGDRVVTIRRTEEVPDLREGKDVSATMTVIKDDEVVMRPGDQYYETLAMQDDKRILGDIDRRWREKGEEINTANKKKKLEKEAAIKAIKDANQNITDARANEIFNEGGQDAYDAKQSKAKINTVRTELENTDSFKLSQTDSEAGLQEKIDFARREGKITGLSRSNTNEKSKEKYQSEVERLEQDMELLKLHKDLDNNELASDQQIRVTNPDGTVSLQPKYPRAPQGTTVADAAADKIKNILGNRKNIEIKKSEKIEADKELMKAWSSNLPDLSPAWKTRHGKGMQDYAESQLKEEYGNTTDETRAILQSPEFLEILTEEGGLNNPVGEPWMQSMAESIGAGAYPEMKKQLDNVLQKYKERYDSAGPESPVTPEQTAVLADQQRDKETETRNRLLQEEKRMTTELSETPQADDNFESNLKVTPVGGKGYNAPVEQKRQSFDAAAEYLTALGHPFPQAAAAQAALESDWGASGLARDNNNFFGMKPGSKNSTQKALRDAGVEFEVKRYATEEVVDAKTLERFKKKYGDGLKIIKEEGSGKTRVKIPGEPFLTFPTPEEGFKGYMAWINHNMGDSLNVSTPKEYLQFLKTKGYATDDNYVEHIIGRAKSAGREI